MSLLRPGVIKQHKPNQTNLTVHAIVLDIFSLQKTHKIPMHDTTIKHTRKSQVGFEPCYAFHGSSSTPRSNH